MDEPITFMRMVDTIRERWRLFAVTALVAIACSVVFSTPYFIKPRYRSEAVVYPVFISTYSVETTTDQLLQLLESNSIRDSLIMRFNLAAHYDIDTLVRGNRTVLNKLYAERVSIEKTRFESVHIRVEDEDPEMARDMVKEILHQTDLLARRLQRKTSAEMLGVIQLGLAHTRAKLDSVEARLNELRQTQGLLDYALQTREFSRGYVQSLGKGTTKEIEARLNALEAHGGEFEQLTLLNANLSADYNKQLSQERQVVLDMGKEITYTNVVVSPEVPDKKIYPIRWLIVLASTIAALLLCYFLVAWDQARNAGRMAGQGR